MILGIGFIMVAAMFPVAIQQTQATAQESIGASVGRTGVDYMQQLASIRVVLPAGNSLTGTTSSGAPSGSPRVIQYGTPTSILLPTLDPTHLPQLVANFPIPGGGGQFPGFPVRIPGQVWSLHETPLRDPYYVYLAGSPNTVLHAQALWQAAARNLILPTDPRFGLAILYKRDLIASTPDNVHVIYAPAPDAQIIVIPMQVRTKGAYDSSDLNHPFGFNAPATIEPALVTFGGSQIQRAQNVTIPTSIFQITNQVMAQRIGEGAYVVIANDGRGIPQWGIPTSAAGTGGLYAGHVFRVGVQQTPSRWTLQPGNDLGPTDPPGTVPFANPEVFVVGRQIIPSQGPQGLVQDVGIYTGFITVN